MKRFRERISSSASALRHAFNKPADKRQEIPQLSGPDLVERFFSREIDRDAVLSHLPAHHNSMATAQAINAGFHKARCSAIDAAKLISVVEHEAGYPSLLEILQQGKDAEACELAAQVMTKLDDGAYQDLVEVMRSGEHKTSRNAAAVGLGGVVDATSFHELPKAVKEKSISAKTAAHAMTNVKLRWADILAWVDDDAPLKELAVRVTRTKLAYERSQRQPWDRLDGFEAARLLQLCRQHPELVGDEDLDTLSSYI